MTETPGKPQPPFFDYSVRQCVVAFFANWWRTFWGSARMYTRWCDTFPSTGKPGAARPQLAWRYWLVQAVWCAPLFALEQAWPIFWLERGWAMWPADCAHRLHYQVSDWVDKHAIWYAWLPPDSGQPNEIGFWYRSDLLPERDRETWDYPDRPRMFVTGSATDGAEMVPVSGITLSVLRAPSATETPDRPASPDGERQ